MRKFFHVLIILFLMAFILAPPAASRDVAAEDSIGISLVEEMTSASINSSYYHEEKNVEINDNYDLHISSSDENYYNVSSYTTEVPRVSHMSVRFEQNYDDCFF